MSEENNDVKSVELPIIFPKVLHRTIYLYVLRNTSIDEKFKIKASFNNDIRCTFNRIEAFDEKKDISPYIYRLELNVTIDNDNRLYVNHQNAPVEIESYRLRLARKIPQTDRTFSDYKDEKDRYIDDPRSTTHYFLFDVNFSKNLVGSPTGKNLFNKIK
jgi:hypothetical protein